MRPRRHPAPPRSRPDRRYPDPLFAALVLRCVADLDTAAAGVLLAEVGGRLRVAASSSPQGRALEMFAAVLCTGPAVDALSTGAQVRCPDVDLDTAHWPGYAAAARAAGFRAVHAVPLRHGGVVLGALSLLDTRPQTLGDDHRDLAQRYADDAAATWHHTSGRPRPEHRPRWEPRPTTTVGEPPCCSGSS
ncbi:GAF domain-containing protein [Actinomycetospora atypica]|uniref:GAF domain-containing protein n=1 Tax=Actinomycetospora atypica TaxID=1290095 RepID=A0ABV9YKE5_9PSEU